MRDIDELNGQTATVVLEALPDNPSADEVVDFVLDECRHRLTSGAAPRELVEMIALLDQAIDARTRSAHQAHQVHPVNEPPADAQMLESLQEMARVCHQINNPLTSIMGRAQILQMKARQEPDSPVAKAAAVINEASQRVAGYVKDMAHVIAAERDRIRSRQSQSQSQSQS